MWLNIVGIIILVAALWFGGLTLLSNIDVFWHILGRDQSAEQVTTNEDTVAPSRPQLNALPTATNESRIEVSGVAEAESTVTLMLNNRLITETFANNEGAFSFENVLLVKGNNAISVIATDEADNKSEPSREARVTLSTEAPDLTVDSPSDGAEFTGDAERTITVSGTTTPGAVLTVNDTRAIVGDEGDFSLALSLHRDGDNEILIVAADQAGNETEYALTVKYNEDDD